MLTVKQWKKKVEGDIKRNPDAVYCFYIRCDECPFSGWKGGNSYCAKITRINGIIVSDKAKFIYDELVNTEKNIKLIKDL